MSVPFRSQCTRGISSLLRSGGGAHPVDAILGCHPLFNTEPPPADHEPFRDSTRYSIPGLGAPFRGWAC